MTRYHTTPEGNIPFTAEEEAEFDALETAHANEQAERTRTAYQRDRAKEYPVMADYIDGIVKGDQAQIQAYIDACLAVKAKYPKP
jgi:hypothetical protein